MRFYVKLTLLIAIGMVSQGLIERHEAELDETFFAVRVMAARLSGESASSESCMDAADALLRRQYVRLARRGRCENAATRPVEERAASVADQLACSLHEPAP